MRVIDMADIIRAMQNETQFVLRCEEVFHDKICLLYTSDAADD